MQISLNIQDALYQKLVNAGIDMQSKINEYLLSLVDKNDYSDSKQFVEDKLYFQQALNEIESGQIETLSHEDIWERIEEYTK